MKSINTGILNYAISIALMIFWAIIPVNAVIDEGSIVAIWLFDEGTGQIAHDSSGNGNDAEFQGGPKWVDGKISKALWFNGTTDYVAVPDSESLDINGDQLSIVAWINGEGWPAANHIVRKLADEEASPIYVLRVHPETVRLILMTGASVTINGGTVLPTEEWLHIAIVYDGGEARVYLNGEMDGSGPVAGEIAQSDAELRIGRGDPAGYFQGTIDEVAIFASALAEEDILSIMEMGLKELVLSVEPAGKLSTAWAGVKVVY